MQSGVSDAASLIPGATETANIERGQEKKKKKTESSRALRDPITTVGCVALCVLARACACVLWEHKFLHARRQKRGGRGDFPRRKSLNC